MITIESAKIFFYISIGVCTIIATLIYSLSTIIISGYFLKTIKKVSTVIKEIEEKINFAKKIVENIKENLTDAEFYLNKIEKISEYFGEITGKDDENDHEEHKKSKRKNKK